MTETEICNMALGRIGATRINDYSDNTETKNEAIQARLHYAQTRDALQRSHLWVFNKKRVKCSQDTLTPDFEYDYQYLLPNDYLRFRGVWDSGSHHNDMSWYSHSIEINTNNQKVILIDVNATDGLPLVYSAKITNTAQFDPLFIEVLVLKLAKKFVTPLAGSDKKVMEHLQADLMMVEPRVRALDRNEGFGTRRTDTSTWNDARLGSDQSQRTISGL